MMRSYVGSSRECRNLSIHYIPHYSVQKDSVTTPIRIVFDCSLYPQLASMTVWNQAPPYSMTCVQLSSDSTYITTTLPQTSKRLFFTSDSTQMIDYTRFLWLSNHNDPNSHLLTYRFQAVIFGATSSPFILNAVLHHQYQLKVADDIKQFQVVYVKRQQHKARENIKEAYFN